MKDEKRERNYFNFEREKILINWKSTLSKVDYHTYRHNLCEHCIYREGYIIQIKLHHT